MAAKKKRSARAATAGKRRPTSVSRSKAKAKGTAKKKPRPRRPGKSLRKRKAKPDSSRARAGTKRKVKANAKPAPKRKVKAKAKPAPKRKVKAKAKPAPKPKRKVKANAKPAPKRKAPKLTKPRKPSKARDDSILWQSYFHDVLTTVKEAITRTVGIKLPSHLRTWRNDERADGVLGIHVGNHPNAIHAVQKVIGDALIDFATQGGYFVSFGFEAPAGERSKDSPTLSQAGASAETWPTQDLGAAIDTVEGTPARDGVLRSVLAHVNVSVLKVRFHWNPYDEQPERMA